MSPPVDPRQQAIDLAAETMAELIEFWGFKSSMGRIWTLLYLSSEALPADVIAERTGLSAGAVSMALTDLLQWGIVDRAPAPTERKRHYQAETDVWAIVRRVIRERELRLVGRAIQRFNAALAILRDAQRAQPADAEIAFMIRRLEGLLSLARVGHTLVEGFADVGRFTLDPIRGLLSGLRTGQGVADGG